MNTLPQNWLIEVTEENQAELDRWRQQVATSHREGTLCVGYTLLSSHHRDGSHYYAASPSAIRSAEPYYHYYQEITLEQFRQITNPKPMNTHPEKWYIQVTKDNMKELNRWRLSVRTEFAARYDHRFGPGCYLLSKYPVDGEGSYFYVKTIEPFPSKFPEYKEITLEQFRQITNSTPNPMPKSIQISRELLNEYYEASTREQKAYLAEHFKLDGTTTDEAIRGLHDLACNKWKPRIKKNHPECFPEDSKYFDFSGHVEKNGYVSVIPEDAAESLGLNHNFIRVRHNPKNEKTHCRSFYLDSDYNWELVQDGTKDGDVVIMALIPTKKQS